MSSDEMARLKWKRMSMVLTVTVIFGILYTGRAFATTNTGTDYIALPRDSIVTWAWKTSDFKGSINREWDDRLSYFNMSWNTTVGDMIMYIGKGQGALPVWFCDIPSTAAISWAGSSAAEVPGRYLYGTYGWAGTKTGEYLHEWYVVFQGKDAEENYISIGSVEVDGVIFDCYKQWMYWGSPADWQFQAHARNKTWSPTVRLQPILQHFIDNGMHRCIVDMKVIIEGFAGSNGNVSYNYLDIPNLSSRVVNRSFEREKGTTQTPFGWATYSPSGNDSDADFVIDTDSYSGDCSLKHSKSGAYSVRTYQNISVPNGTYTFKVRAKTSSGGTRSISARNFGGTDIYQTVGTSTGSFSEASITNIKVTNGNIGLWLATEAATSNIWTLWDCVDLIRTNKPNLTLSVTSSAKENENYRVNTFVVNNTSSAKTTKLVYALLSDSNKLLSICLKDVSVNANTSACDEGLLACKENATKIKIYSYNDLTTLMPNADIFEISSLPS